MVTKDILLFLKKPKFFLVLLFVSIDLLDFFFCLHLSLLTIYKPIKKFLTCFPTVTATGVLIFINHCPPTVMGVRICYL